MDARHVIEVFTEGCSSCEGVIAYAHELAASAGESDVRVWNVKEDESHEGSTRMEQYGIQELPAIVVDGEPLPCCR